MARGKTLVGRVVQRSRLSMREVADLTGYSYQAVYAWRAGDREPSAEALRTLATALQGHAVELEDLAAELYRAADKRDDGR